MRSRRALLHAALALCSLLGACGTNEAKSAPEPRLGAAGGDAGPGMDAGAAPSIADGDGGEGLPLPDAGSPAVRNPSNPNAPDGGLTATEDEEPFEDELSAEELSGPLPKGVKRDRVLGGLHFRFRSGRGVIHVWLPPGYRSKTAGIVVYVHGYGSPSYRNSADRAWSEHKLAEQFKASRQNAIFIVPDAPNTNEESVRYPKLSELLRAVWKNTHLKRPRGPLVAIAHSGGFRSITGWLDYRPLAHVILLDALFAGQEKFVAWLETVKGHENHKLTMVGQRTASAAESFLRHFNQKTIVRLTKIPAKFSDLPKKARTARILYIRSQYGHMQLVTSMKVVPVMLRRTPLKPI